MFSKIQIQKALKMRTELTAETDTTQYFITRGVGKEHYVSRDKTKKFWDGWTCDCNFCNGWGYFELNKQKWCYVKLAVAIWLWKNKKIPEEIWNIITTEMGENVKLLGE